MRKLTTEEWIKKAKKVRGDQYDYSKVNYTGIKEKVCIICKEHGEFWQTPGDHINKLANCPKCGHTARVNGTSSTTEKFIEKAKKVHGDKYDYSKVHYKNAKTKIEIICPVHGSFWQTPNNHLNGQNCPECGLQSQIKKQSLTLKDFIDKSNKVHNFKYDYSKSNYINHRSNICIICPEHGEFWQNAGNHLAGSGCPKCAIETNVKNKLKTNDQFIKEASLKHNNKYDYSKTKYTNAFDKVIIICPEHGEFEQRAYAHLQGQGCPKCIRSKGEELIENYLKENNINYICQYEITIDNTINSSGFAYIDFYLPDYDLYIEYNGIQHYKYTPFLQKGGMIDFEHQVERDNFIRNLYKEKLIEFSYLQSDSEIINKLNEIKRNKNNSIN